MVSLYTRLYAQETGIEWLQKMNQQYATATSLKFEFEAMYYSNHSRIKPLNTMTGKVISSGQNYYSDAMGREIIVSGKSTLIVDNEQLTITCLPGSDKPDKKQKGATAVGPDSAWLVATEITLLNQSGDLRTIVIKEKNSIYERTEILINATTYAMEQVVYYYSTMESGGKPCFVVNYKNVAFNTTIPDAVFSEKKYIQRKNGTIVSMPAWSKYTIVDLTDRYDN